MRRMTVPDVTGFSDAETVCVREWCRKVDAVDLLSGFEVIEVVKPDSGGQYIGMRTSLNLRFCPAGVMLSI